VTAALAGALRAAAAGSYPDEAGTELLIRHGGILARQDFRAFVHAGTGITGPATAMAWIDWDAAITARLPLSGGERRILQLAASIAAGTPAALRETIPGLDTRNLALVTTAIRHAAGHRPGQP
jgi:hypothetical protein